MYMGSETRKEHAHLTYLRGSKHYYHYESDETPRLLT